MTAIIKKEMRTYFTSINGYVFAGFFIFLTAIYFGMYNLDNASADYTQTMASTVIMFLILIPALTMRLFADEMRQKTDQLLYTSPLTVTQIVLGKFFASFILFALSLLVTMLFPLIMSRYGEISWAETLCSFVGFLLLGTCFISIGLFISSLTESQIVAAVASFASLFLFFIIDMFAATVPKDRVSSIIFIAVIIAGISFLLYDATKNIVVSGIMAGIGALGTLIAYLVNDLLFDSVIYNFLTWFSILTRFSYFNYGILNIADIIYYVTFSIAFVFLTVNTIEKRRWK